MGKGSHRSVYRHPDSEDLCVKVMTQDWRLSARRLRAHWLVRLLRPKWYYHENLTEYRYAMKARQRLGEKIWNLIPQIHGHVNTDQGEGMVVELIRDHDGKISMTLEAHLRKYGLTEEYQKAIDAMWKRFEENIIFIEGRPDNIVLSKRSNGSYQAIPIDGFTFAQLIPVARWIASVRRKKFEKMKSKQQMWIAKTLSGQDLKKA